MGITEIRQELSNLMNEHGAYTPEYTAAAIEVVQKRMSDLEQKLNDKYFGGTHVFIDAPDAQFVEPNTEKFESTPYAEAREALQSTGHKFSGGAWYLAGGMGSRFSPHIVPINEQLTLEEVIEFGYRIGVSGLAFHTRGEMGPNNREATLKNLEARGMRVSSEFANQEPSRPKGRGMFRRQIISADLHLCLAL